MAKMASSVVLDALLAELAKKAESLQFGLDQAKRGVAEGRDHRGQKLLPEQRVPYWFGSLTIEIERTITELQDLAAASRSLRLKLVAAGAADEKVKP